MAYGRTASKAVVSASNTQVILLAANPARKGATIRNTDSNILYIDLLTGVGPNDHLQAIISGGYFEMPYAWKGTIYGVWANTANGNAQVREIV